MGRYYSFLLCLAILAAGISQATAKPTVTEIRFCLNADERGICQTNLDKAYWPGYPKTAEWVHWTIFVSTSASDERVKYEATQSVSLRNTYIGRMDVIGGSFRETCVSQPWQHAEPVGGEFTGPSIIAGKFLVKSLQCRTATIVSLTGKMTSQADGEMTDFSGQFRFRHRRPENWKGKWL